MTSGKQAGPVRASGYCNEHKRATCPECAAEKLRRVGFDVAIGPDKSVEMNYQMNGGRMNVLDIEDKSDPKNAGTAWLDEHMDAIRLAAREAELFSDLYLCRAANKRLRAQIEDRDHEIRVLRQACASAGAEIRELHAQRKPEKHGAYWLTFPECSTSAGMYGAVAVLLASAGGLLLWLLA